MGLRKLIVSSLVLSTAYGFVNQMPLSVGVNRVLNSQQTSKFLPFQSSPLQQHENVRTFQQDLHMSDFDEGGAVSAGGFNSAGEPPIQIRGFSLAKAFLFGGLAITTFSFTEFFLTDGSEGLSGLGFIYGVPILLIGAALQYAELPPVPVASDAKGDAIFDAKATETLKKVKEDVTRHRYGDDAHLDTTIKALGLVMSGKEYPELKSLKQEDIDGELKFSMVFQSLDTPYKIWAEPNRIERYARFFGPGLTATVEKVDSKERLVAICLQTGAKPAAEKSEDEASTAESKESVAAE